MKWTTWMLFAASLLLLLAVGVMVSRQASRTPEAEFAAIEKRIAQGNIDIERTIANLDQVLARAQNARSTELQNKVRVARGKLLMRVGAFERARNDLKIVLDAGYDERAVERLLVELEQRAGDYRAALARLSHILEVDPGHGEDWARKGELCRQAGDKMLSTEKASLAKVLAPESTAKALPLIELASALDPTDPKRVAVGHDLRQLFGFTLEKEGEEALVSADTCSRDFATARDAFARSFAMRFDAQAFGTLFELLRRAGHNTEAVDLCTAAMRVPAVRSDARVTMLLMDALTDLDRPQFAGMVTAQWITRGQAMSAEFYLDCCRVLYKAKQWNDLGSAAQQLSAVGTAAQSDVCQLFWGLSAAGMNGFDTARFFLTRYVISDVADPLPNARAIAWRELARACRQLSDAQEEREALEEAVDRDPDHDGESWLRLAELQLAMPHGGVRQPETRWAKGMSLLPARVPELLPRWRELGELELKSLGIDLTAQQHDLVSEHNWTPSPDASPYELYRLARLQLADGDIGRAQDSVRRLLEIVPGFVPGLDLSLEVAQKVGKMRGIVDALLERLKVVGPDEETRQVLAKIPPSILQPADVLVIMRSSPDRFGRLAVARTYFDHGEIDRALATLEGLPEDAFGASGRVLAAQIHLLMQRPEEALKVLAPVRGQMLHNDAGTQALVSAALAAGDDRALASFMADLATQPAPNKAQWLALCDRMLQAGALAPARALLRRLDSGPATRGGDVLLRLASAELAEGRSAPLAQTLVRMQASDKDGEIQHLNVLTRLQGPHAGEFKAAVSQLRAGRYKPTRLESAMLDVLAEQPTKARATIESGLDTEPKNAQWQLASAVLAALTPNARDRWSPPAYLGRDAAQQTELFLHGSAASDDSGPVAAHARDARWAACMLLAMQATSTRPWVQAQLRETTAESHGELWPDYFRALLARGVGDAPGARKWLDQLLHASPDFGPAWDLLEELARARKDDERAMSALRLERTQAMGEQSIAVSLQWLDRARVLALKGEDEAALHAARTAAELDPVSIEIQATLGALAAARGEFADAIVAYRSACSRAGSPADPADLHAFLRVMDEAERAAPPAITREDHLAELEKLLERSPDDPRIPVAMARLDLALDPNNPSFAVARAYTRLDRFRARHKTRSLESLAPGSTAEWVDFHVALDPARAEAFLKQELELEPGSLAPWLLLARVYSAENRAREAVDQFALVFRLAPQMSVVREYARARVWTEMPAEGVLPLMRSVMDAEGLTEPDSELLELGARALYNTGPGGVGRAITLLEQTGAKHDAAPSSIERGGLLRALSWCARGTPEDLAHAQETLGEILPMAVDPYRRTVIVALAGMVRTTGALNVP